MKQSHFLLFLFLILSFNVNGQTHVSGGINSDTTWTLGNSPYIIDDTVIVFPGVSLTIQPGVVVKFEDNKRLEIRGGNLFAEGTLIDSILFTSNTNTPTPGQWGEIFIHGVTGYHQQVELNYCKFEYAINAVYFENFTPLLSIKNSNFHYNINGINGGMHLDVDSCDFKQNTIGLANLSGCIINHCYISNNQFGFLQCDWKIENSIIRLNNVGFNKNCTGLHMKNCIIDSNQIGINQLWGSNIDSCIIRNNFYGILDSAYAHYEGHSSISNCQIDSNYTGICFNNIERTSVTSCIISNNNIGISDNGGDTPNEFRRNTIENNSIGVELKTFNDNFNCNKICSNTIYNVKYPINTNVNFSNNYWCGINPSAIDSSILGPVVYLPIDTTECYQCTLIIYNLTGTDISCPSCQDGELTIVPKYGTPPYSYIWNTTPIQTTQSISGLSAGTYTVFVTDSGGCTERSAPITLSGTSPVNEIFGELSFSIFPIPALENITVEFPIKISKTEIKIFNILGELEFYTIVTMNKTEMNISLLRSGIHIIQLSAGDKIGRKIFLKQ